MRGSDRVIKKELHLLRSANADRLLQALLLVEVLKEVQRILRLSHRGGIFGRRFSLGIYFKVDAVLGAVGTCIGARRALQPPRLGCVESLEKIPELVYRGGGVDVVASSEQRGVNHAARATDSIPRCIFHTHP